MRRIAWVNWRYRFGQNTWTNWLDARFHCIVFAKHDSHTWNPEAVSRQTAWLGNYLGIKGEPGERHRIWPIVQLAGWGESVPIDKVQSILDHGTRRPVLWSLTGAG